MHEMTTTQVQIRLRRTEFRHHPIRQERRLIVNDMARLRLIEAQSYRQRDIDAATFARILRSGRVDPARPVRVRIGRSIIRLGERLASEPSLRPVRPR